MLHYFNKTRLEGTGRITPKSPRSYPKVTCTKPSITRLAHVQNHPNRPYRTFSVARPIIARINEMIQKRMTMVGSDQPSFS